MSGSGEGLHRRAVDYVADGDRTADLVSPIFADLTGLPPLLIQAGSHEILLDDATRLASRAAGADVAVSLEVTRRRRRSRQDADVQAPACSRRSPAGRRRDARGRRETDRRGRCPDRVSAAVQVEDDFCHARRRSSW